METIIGIKQLHKDLKLVADETKKGFSFVVVKNSKPIFKIIPYENEPKKKYTINDLKRISFGGGKNLSRDIDSIIYK